MRKSLAVTFVVILSILICNISLGQNNKSLEISLYPLEIKSDDFDGRLVITLVNISNETIYITTEPFNYDIVKTDEFGSDVSFSGNEYAPNRIIFFRTGINPPSLDCASKVSFLQFPKILSIKPNEKCEITLNFNEHTLLELKGSNWRIFKDIWFAKKTIVDEVIYSKPGYIKEEFEKSIFFIDKFQINIPFKLQPVNSSIYFYNSLDSCSERDKCNTVYDSIILKCFNNYSY